MRFFHLLIWVFAGFAQNNKPVTPSKNQLQWHNLEYYAFVHFGPNSFTDKEWGDGTEKEEVFNPSKLDCRQWAKTAKAAGMRGIIITAKHHDGFCLFPSAYSTHTVRESQWRNGQGDVLKDLSEACAEYGLKMGVYLSPWDRNHPKYGTPEYNDVFDAMLTEVLTNYGPIFEVWFDGANGEGPNGKKQVYDFDRFNATVRRLQPQAVIFSDCGPDVRWVGNEKGFAGQTNWHTMKAAELFPAYDKPERLNVGDADGTHWLPAECDVSIRPGWFYHKAEDDKVKTADQLMEIWLGSVGRGANLLLNLPVDGRGQVHPNDTDALMKFKKLRDKAFKNNLVDTKAKWKQSTDAYVLDLGHEKEFDTIELAEDISKGQAIAEFEIELLIGEDWVLYFKGTTVGRKRIIDHHKAQTSQIRITLHKKRQEAFLLKPKIFLTNL